MKHENYEDADNSVKCDSLEVKGLTFAYPGGHDIFENVTFEAEKGDIIGVTGSVACGKSTLGKVFLCEYPLRLQAMNYQNLMMRKRQDLQHIWDMILNCLMIQLETIFLWVMMRMWLSFLRQCALTKKEMIWKTDRTLMLGIQV